MRFQLSESSLQRYLSKFAYLDFPPLSEVTDMGNI
jgi:hypothetical protein